MKKIILLIFFSSSLFSQISSKKIDRWISNNDDLNGSIVSIAVKRIDKAKKIVGSGIDIYMTPASNVKITTLLGSIYYGDSIPIINYKISNDTLKISPTGYPLLLHPKYRDKDLAKFLKKFKHIVYHTPKIDLNKYGPGWAWDDYNSYYQAERSEMPIYGNVVQIIKNSNGEIEVTPDRYKIIFDFNQKKKIHRSETENKFFINPSLIKFGDTIYSPFITSRKNTISLLENSLGNKVEFNKNELKDYSSLNTTRVNEIYSAILKDSDNLISESIAANISFRLNDTISVDKGVKLIQDISEQIELFDGSGLSRYNLVTPRSVILSLLDIYNLIGFDRIKKIFPENYIIQNEENFVWGKTGTLKNNHNYSGYIITDKRKLYVFSIMINHFTEELANIKNAIADFLIFLKSS